MQKVLEVRHHSPYDGCFEEFNYFLLEVTHNNRGESAGADDRLSRERWDRDRGGGMGVL